MRKFEVCKGFENAGVNLPARSTSESAGYDVEAIEDTIIPSIWTSDNKKGTLVKTGIKIYCKDSEYVGLYSRSSNFNKLGLLLANGVGVVDSDYADNVDNDGHVMFNFVNMGGEDLEIKKGTRIGQAIFMPYLLTEDDEATSIRVGGYGSTGL